MLSVAMCTYNGAFFIEEQLLSILNQTMSVDEIVICDDGSIDQTLDIINSIQSKSSIDIRVYKNEKQLGVCANFQKAVNLCKGNIIFLSDQDDIWKREKVETVVRYFLEKPQVKVVFTNGQLINKEGHIVENSSLFGCFGLTAKSLNAIDNGLGVELFAYENRATGATMAIRSDFEYMSSFVNYCYKGILHDGALVMLSLNNCQLGHIDDCLIDYRIHSNQKCGIGDNMNVSISDDPREISYTAVLWDKIAIPDGLKKRISFILFREKCQHQRYGLLSLIRAAHSYRLFYSKRWLYFLRYDINQWLRSVFHYIA